MNGWEAAVKIVAVICLTLVVLLGLYLMFGDD